MTRDALLFAVNVIPTFSRKQVIAPRDIRVDDAEPAVPGTQQTGVQDRMKKEKRQGKCLKLLIRLINQIFDPHFLLVTSILGFLGYAMIGMLEIVLKVPLALYVGVLFGVSLMVAVFNWDWPGIMKELTIDEEMIRRAVEAGEQYHAARLAERKEQFGNAAELYEKVLAHDASNIQARFSVARAYLRRLKDPERALRHLQVLAQTAPQGHPYHAYAVEEMGKLKREQEQGGERPQ